MAEQQATNQDGNPLNPEAAPKLDLDAYRDRRDGEKLSEREYLAKRRAERAAAAEQLTQDASTSEAEQEVTTELTQDETQVSDPDAQATEGTEGQQADGSETEADDTYFPENLTEFAEALGVEPKDFMQGVTQTVTVNGESRNVPLEDLVRSYSSQEERGRVSNELAEQQKAIQAEAERHQTEYQNRIQQADAMLDSLKVSIDLGPDEATLSQMLASGQIDERQYLTARADRDAKTAAFNKAVDERNQFVRQEMEKAQTAQKKARADEQEGLLNWKPELRDPAQLSAFETRVRGNLTKHYGLTDEQVSSFFQTYTLPQVKIVNDAIAYQELKAQEKPLRKKLHQLPKLQKAGAKRSAGQQANDAVLGARSRLKSSGSAQDAVALLRAQRARKAQRHGGSQ